MVRLRSAAIELCIWMAVVDRVIDPASIAKTRAFLCRRLPGLADQPIVESRVCQYEATSDTHFVIDRHPELANAWIVGGGSGHGFKHGPRIGRYVVDRLDGATDRELDERFSITRVRPPSRGMRSAVPAWVAEAAGALASVWAATTPRAPAAPARTSRRDLLELPFPSTLVRMAPSGLCSMFRTPTAAAKWTITLH